jgi:uncharacterized protein
MRLFSSFAHYLATHDATGLQIHHFAPAFIAYEPAPGQCNQLELVTEYPWQGLIQLRVVETGSAPWTISLRIPEWSQHPHVSINGNILSTPPRLEKGYLVLERAWQAEDRIELDLGMQPVWMAPNPRIDATRGCLAIQRGPIVYCLEDRDQQMPGHLLDVEMDTRQPLTARWDANLLDGVTVIEAQGQFADPALNHVPLYAPLGSTPQTTHQAARLVAIPYYAWGNRGIGAMRVWIPEISRENHNR